MNNTINSARLNRSNPSFGSFSTEVEKILNKNNVNKLIEKKVSLNDLDYLRKHSLDIRWAKAGDSKYDGYGLFLMNQHTNADRVTARTLGGTRDIKLTPTKLTINDGLFEREFRDVIETLPNAMKKALKVLRKFDAIAKAKQGYFDKFGEEIRSLKGIIGSNENMYSNRIDSFLSKIDSSGTDDSLELKKLVEKQKKELSRYKDESYFDNKQNKLFS